MDTAADISYLPHLQSKTSGFVERHAYFPYNIVSYYTEDEIR